MINNDTNLYEYIIKRYDDVDIKSLEIGIPIIKTYHNLAFPMSIICFQDVVKGCFFSNFINVYTYYNEEVHDFKINYDVQYYEDEVYYLHRENIQINTMDKLSNNIIEKIILLIDSEKYICLFIDEYYINNTLSTEICHNEHELLIYGYDKCNKILKCLFYGNDLHLKTREVTFEEFEKAYYSKFLNRKLPILCYSYYERNAWFRPDYSIDPKYIKHLLVSYINSTNFLYDRRHVNPLNCSQFNSYGINVYDSLCKYCRRKWELNEEIDLRQLYFIYENKVIMKKRLLYMYKNSLLRSEECIHQFENVVKNAKKILNIVIKYNLNRKKYENDYDRINNIINQIKEMKKNETDIINNVINSIVLN